MADGIFRAAKTHSSLPGWSARRVSMAIRWYSLRSSLLSMGSRCAALLRAYRNLETHRYACRADVLKPSLPLMLLSVEHNILVQYSCWRWRGLYLWKPSGTGIRLAHVPKVKAATISSCEGLARWGTPYSSFMFAIALFSHQDWELLRELRTWCARLNYPIWVAVYPYIVPSA